MYSRSPTVCPQFITPSAPLSSYPIETSNFVQVNSNTQNKESKKELSHFSQVISNTMNTDPAKNISKNSSNTVHSFLPLNEVDTLQDYGTISERCASFMRQLSHSVNQETRQQSIISTSILRSVGSLNSKLYESKQKCNDSKGETMKYTQPMSIARDAAEEMEGVVQVFKIHSTSSEENDNAKKKDWVIENPKNDVPDISASAAGKWISSHGKDSSRYSSFDWSPELDNPLCAAIVMTYRVSLIFHSQLSAMTSTSEYLLRLLSTYVGVLDSGPRSEHSESQTTCIDPMLEPLVSSPRSALSSAVALHPTDPLLPWTNQVESFHQCMHEEIDHILQQLMSLRDTYPSILLPVLLDGTMQYIDPRLKDPTSSAVYVGRLSKKIGSTAPIQLQASSTILGIGNSEPSSPSLVASMPPISSLPARNVPHRHQNMTPIHSRHSIHVQEQAIHTPPTRLSYSIHANTFHSHKHDYSTLNTPSQASISNSISNEVSSRPPYAPQEALSPDQINLHDQELVQTENLEKNDLTFDSTANLFTS